tara:strand:- start:299 stop:1147 length:849 start_codon:yes stop_codon:yes gene_type:complete
MIFWIASYPKSGNTWLRALISSYFFSKDGNFSKEIIKNIDQFPEKIHFQSFDYDPKNITDTTKFWIKAQEKINNDKKIRFFKTHNVFGKINNQPFTDKKNSIACIYIVRDPRNVITSLKNHYELSYNEAFDFITNERRYIYDQHKIDDFSDFQFIGSWKTNFQSWNYQKEIPMKLVKYENLLSDTYSTSLEIIQFVDKIMKNNEGINKKKLENAINSTSFEKLKKEETVKGFSEAILSKERNKKIPFFYLGPENDWKKILDEKIQTKLSETFKDNLKELLYI